MRDQWNTALFPTLKDVSLEKDKTITKKRPSGFWGGTGIEEHLAVLGITTLLFAGTNTHRGLEETIRDASNKGWDCLLFIDGVHAMQAEPECLDTIFFNQALTIQETHVEA
ncbi:hypothetical protein CEP52_000814 [Fusarium oligoseptatum]|uniref:Isochorismatase-like domain-containing protein n=1 Tax=Fusarium oligoseptatum TaxID=2604345 RepID=A0A428UM87_9HYPO|nr:hypothetical protein CEP52_000814 [Fusarium oligoseptatum]